MWYGMAAYFFTQCRIIKQIGQGAQEKETSGADTPVSCWSSDYEQWAVFLKVSQRSV